MSLREKAAKLISDTSGDRAKNSYDNSMFPHEPDRRSFAENDGDTANKKLSLKQKHADSNDQMTVMSSVAERAGNRSRNT
jgi:hypothetical protein